MIGQRPPEPGKEVLGIRQFGNGVDRDAILPEVACVEFRIQSACSGTDHHAEFAGVVQSDPQFDAGRMIGGEGVRLELKLQTG